VLTTRPARVDVEVRGELTRGMTVVDTRPEGGRPNVDLAVSVEVASVRDYIDKTLRRAA
jgi:inosine-uridine nucleoside N-ribohydrolase